jgi:hypothetical protein
MKTNINVWSYLDQFFLEWKIFQTKVVEKIETPILCSITVLENRTVYEIMWKSIVERGRPQTIWCIHIACWIPKATDTLSQCVILITFPLQQWLHERTSMLRHTYTQSNKNPSVRNFLSPTPEVTCGTVAIIIRVVLLSPYLRLRGVSLSSIHYNQSHRVYMNRRQQYICLIWN